MHGYDNTPDALVSDVGGCPVGEMEAIHSSSRIRPTKGHFALQSLDCMYLSSIMDVAVQAVHKRKVSIDTIVGKKCGTILGELLQSSRMGGGHYLPSSTH